jgi:hypothetical protein
MMIMSGGDFGVKARLIWNVGRSSRRNIILTRVESVTTSVNKGFEGLFSYSSLIMSINL